jgi:hypothetical protein
VSTAPGVTDLQDENEAPAAKPLSDVARKALETLLQGIMREEQSARRAEVRKASQQRLFKNGFQYLWWDDRAHAYSLPEASGQELPRFMDVYDIYTPHHRSLTSILSQNPAGINFQPEDLQQSRDVTAANYAEKMRTKFDRMVEMQERQAEIADTFCTDGRAVTWTRIDKDGELEASVHGVLETKVPIYARKVSKWGYAVISFEEDVYELKAEFPDYAESIKSDEGTSGETAYERYARLGVLANRRGGEADAFKGLATRHTAWIRPSRFQKASDEAKAELATLYPEGVRITVVSGKCVEAEPETIEAALKVGWPSRGKGSSRPSMLNGLVPIQIAFNDCMNMLREHIDYSIPARWVTDTVDSEALAEQRSAPGVIHTLTIPAGASIRDLVMQEDVAQLPPELVANIDRLLTLAQFTTGDLPSLYGDGTPDQDTYQGQKMLSDHAKGQFTTAWHALQTLEAGTYEIGIRLAAQMDADKPSIAIAGGNGQSQINPGAILDGNWGCYANKDSAFPETVADQRASLQNVLTQLSQGGEKGIEITFHPDNLKLIKQYSGLKDLVIPGAEARDKQLREIEQLLRETPIPDESKIDEWEQQAMQAVAAGQQPPEMPMTSSIPVGKYDYNQPELDKCIEWLSSSACHEEQQKGNSQGVMNVQLHADLHQAAISQAAAAAAAAQQEPMKISAAFKDLDPATKVQALVRDGYKPDEDAYQTQTVVDQQNVAADTQDKAASATHKSVLAAKEAVAPVERKSQIDEVKDE